LNVPEFLRSATFSPARALPSRYAKSFHLTDTHRSDSLGSALSSGFTALNLAWPAGFALRTTAKPARKGFLGRSYRDFGSSLNRVRPPFAGSFQHVAFLSSRIGVGPLAEAGCRNPAATSWASAISFFFPPGQNVHASLALLPCWGVPGWGGGHSSFLPSAAPASRPGVTAGLARAAMVLAAASPRWLLVPALLLLPGARARGPSRKFRPVFRSPAGSMWGHPAAFPNLWWWIIASGRPPEF